MKYAIACKNSIFFNNLKAFQPEILNGASHIITKKDDLSTSKLIDNGIEIIFFPHWSWIVPVDILNNFICVGFHSSPVPYGRGGSPIQNMVLSGHEKSEVVALKMNEFIDSGPVYMRRELTLIGGGEEIILRIYKIIIDMISELLVELPIPIEQSGIATIFSRRKSADSRINFNNEINYIFDKIRILDIDGYPPAFVDIGEYRLTFTHPSIRFNDKIDARVMISRKCDEK